MERLNISDSALVQSYEDFLQSNGGDFLQSTLWANVKPGWLQEIYIFRDSSGKIIGSFAVLIKKISVLCFNFSFIYCPRGPLIDWKDKEMSKAFLNQVKSLMHKHHGIFFKMEPALLKDDTVTIEAIKSLGFKLSLEDIQCKDNYILNIENRDKEELINSFKKQWRYNIRYAPKKGVTCDFYGTDRLGDFYSLLEETAERDNFPIREQAYFKRMMESLGDEHCKLCLTYLDDEPLTGAIICIFGGRVSYVYGASSNRHRNLMPNYYMQWTMMSYAIDHHQKIYDFQGIPHFDDPNSPNYGTYHFKKGFNGEVVQYVPGFDIVRWVPRKLIYKFKKYM